MTGTECCGNKSVIAIENSLHRRSIYTNSEPSGCAIIRAINCL